MRFFRTTNASRHVQSCLPRPSDPPALTCLVRLSLCLQCSSVSGDKHCKVCHKNALGLNLKTNKQECRRCMPFARNGDGAKVAVHKNKQGRCNPCNKCPYKEGWAGCDDKGRCTKCRTKDGFTLTESGKCLK